MAGHVGALDGILVIQDVGREDLVVRPCLVQSQINQPGLVGGLVQQLLLQAGGLCQAFWPLVQLLWLPFLGVLSRALVRRFGLHYYIRKSEFL